MSQTARGNLPKPEVQIALDPTPQPRLQAIGGGQDVRWNNSLVFGLAYALPRIHGSDCAAVANAAIAGLTNIKPSDPVEGMIAGQMIAAHEAALNIYAWAWNPALRVAKGPGSRASPLQCRTADAGCTDASRRDLQREIETPGNTKAAALKLSSSAEP